MELGDSTDVGVDSIDLYSRVKLRDLNNKVCYDENEVFAALDGKPPTARSTKFRGRINQGVLSRNVAANLETPSGRNVFAAKSSRLRSLKEVMVKETDGFSARRSDNKEMDYQLAVQDFDNSDLMLDEGTAIEMLDAPRKERPKCLSNSNLDIGDLVWGRVKSYPWWPGQIFDEALASPLVQSEKREGSILVSFYGDQTYAWLDPEEVIPFDVNYAENLKQTKVKTFYTAVEEALTEIKRRVVFGMGCNCQHHFKMLERTSVKHIQKARDDFRPEQIIDFLKQSALNPREKVKKNPHWIKNVANFSAYRKAVVLKQIKEAHAQDIKALECPSGIIEENQKASQAPFSDPLNDEASIKTKRFKQRNVVDDLRKNDQPNVSHESVLRKQLEANDLHIKCEESEFFRRPIESEMYSRSLVTMSDIAKNLGDIPKDSSNDNLSKVLSADVEMISHQVKCSPSKIFPVKISPDGASRNPSSSCKPSQEQFRSNGVTTSGNKRRISGCLEDVSLEIPVRPNKIKSSAWSAAETKPLDSQGERKIALRSDTLFQLQKKSQLKPKSIRRDVIERMLTVKFPPESNLPSVSEVKAKFARFGPLDDYSTRFLWKLSAFQLVFLHKRNAEVAYHHAIKNTTLFSSSEVRYYLAASESDLNEPDKSSGLPENQEIQPVKSLISNKYARDEKMSASSRPSLLLQEKNRLESPVKKLSPKGTDCPRIIKSESSVSILDSFEVPKETVPTSLKKLSPKGTDCPRIIKSESLVSILDSFEVPKEAVPTPVKELSPKGTDCPRIIKSESSVSIIDSFEIPKEAVSSSSPSNIPLCSNITCTTNDAMKIDDLQNTNVSDGVGISHQLIDLFTRCSGILGELKTSYEHMF